MSEKIEIINKNDTIVLLYRNWLENADKLCDKLRNEIQFETQEVVVYGNTYISPRRVYAFGDDNLKIHKYSNSEVTMNKWIKEIKDIRDALNKLFNVNINSCLMNEYSDGTCSIGWHSDREAMGNLNLVMTVSLGGPRDFYIRSKRDKKELYKLSLQSGDLVIMSGNCQRDYLHTVPKRASAKYRISLTFRELRDN